MRLANFDQVIPDEVFREVTSITLEQFRRLRDGGVYVDAEGQEHSYPGLFDAVVFDDSIREFLRLRAELSDYFDENQTGDIFDYIPPQKTNQIFTPKRVVKQMVDMLEAENPGCFDRDDKTFADLYMKSDLYIAEIVKRLYQSEAVKQKYPVAPPGFAISSPIRSMASPRRRSSTASLRASCWASTMAPSSTPITCASWTRCCTRRKERWKGKWRSV